MKRILFFLLLVAVLLLAVACGNASMGTETSAPANTTEAPSTTLGAVDESSTTTPEQVTTTPTTANEATETTPQTPEDDSLYRVGFGPSNGVMGSPCHVAYEIQKECSIFSENVPITLYYGVYAYYVEHEPLPDDCHFKISLQTLDGEILYSFRDVTFAELKENRYIWEQDFDNGTYSFTHSETITLDHSVLYSGEGKLRWFVEYTNPDLSYGDIFFIDLEYYRTDGGVWVFGS